ncbi:hypothetical protein BKA70DRAFT_1431131 [Coprinopsis sp. MPI-PUGE-AT-0042]|nr:hypothetical protein BKA70DRAFT_1431131 [Coprinopsis sp. MPI-PUGE-AT-0042]
MSLDVPVVENILNMIFDGEKVWEAKGLESPIKKWYKRVATGSTAVRSRIADGRLSNARSIVWNTKNPWLPENLYFRSNDTCRLLQMSCAVYRVQIYALPSLWSYLEQLAKKRKQDRESGLEGTKQFIVASIIHEVTMLRNFHDFGGSDIPIFVTNWTSTQMDAACDYWATYSEGHWTKEEAKVEYDALNRAHFLPGKSNPCFHQADCLLRRLVSDPAAEYLPPFIVLQSILPDGKARAIFTRPQVRASRKSHPRLSQDPVQAVDCTNDNCSFFDLDKSFSLADGSPMVRKSLFGRPDGEV